MSEQRDDPKYFDPDRMQEIVDRLKREGRMPTMEQFANVMSLIRPEYQKAISPTASRRERKPN